MLKLYLPDDVSIADVTLMRLRHSGFMYDNMREAREHQQLTAGFKRRHKYKLVLTQKARKNRIRNVQSR